MREITSQQQQKHQEVLLNPEIVLRIPNHHL